MDVNIHMMNLKFAMPQFFDIFGLLRIFSKMTCFN